MQAGAAGRQKCCLSFNTPGVAVRPGPPNGLVAEGGRTVPGFEAGLRGLGLAGSTRASVSIFRMPRMGLPEQFIIVGHAGA